MSHSKEHFILSGLPDYYKQACAKVRVAMCQVYTEEWDIEGNIKRALEAIEIAAAQNAEIAVTPECVIHGYATDESNGKSADFREKLHENAESLTGSHLQLFRNKAREKGIHVLVGFAEQGEGKQIHNTAALISPDGNYVYVYRKVHCRNFESIHHTGCFTPGNDFFSSPLKLKEGIFNAGTIICFDREIPETFRCMRSLCAEIVLCPLATDTSDIAVWRNSSDNENITRSGSACSELFTVVVNHAGRFNGGSFIIGPMGEVLCQMNDQPDVLTIDLPLGIISQKFHTEPFGWMGWGYRRPEVYSKYI